MLEQLSVEVHTYWASVAYVETAAVEAAFTLVFFPT